MNPSTIADSARSVIIAFNPNSGALDRTALVQQLAAALEELGFAAELHSDVSQIRERSRQLHQQGQLRAVVAAGGDGTVSLLANELAAGTPIAIFPLGTENLLAKFLQMEANVAQVAATIAGGRTRQLDAGRANGKLFLVMASCGFDAAVVQELHAQRRGHIRHWSYAMPILSVIRRYKYPAIRIEIDGEDQPFTSRWAFIFNVPRYAMNIPILPEADAADGQLDLCAFQTKGFLEGIWTLGAVLMRRHRQWVKTRISRFRKIRIESDQPVPYQLDGDPGGMLPLQIEVDPACLTVVVPD